MKIKKGKYVRPSIDVTKIVLESGFAQSGFSPSPSPISPRINESTWTTGSGSTDFYF